jgi:hypothetical protein
MKVGGEVGSQCSNMIALWKNSFKQNQTMLHEDIEECDTMVAHLFAFFPADAQ